MIRYRRGKWTNAWVIGGYPFTAERERLINSLGGGSEIFINTTKDEYFARLESSGRNVEEWQKYIEDWWHKYSPHS